jgi:hypothetical protein
LPEGVGIGFSPEHFVPGYTAQRTLAFLPSSLPGQAQKCRNRSPKFRSLLHKWNPLFNTGYT